LTVHYPHVPVLLMFQSQAYLMMASLGQHRLSSISLGHKHKYGLDGVPEDQEQAYRKS
jgi:TPR repeat protein